MQEPTFVTGRTAERMLGAVGIPRSQAQLVLAAGIAGTPARQGRATLYRREQVKELTRRRILTRVDLERWRAAAGRDGQPDGLLVLRRAHVAGKTEAQRLEDLACGWELGVYTAGVLRVHLGLGRRIGVLGTVAGFVHGGWELTGTGWSPDVDGKPRWRVRLAEPGEWVVPWRDTRIDLGRGKAWTLLHPD